MIRRPQRQRFITKSKISRQRKFFARSSLALVSALQCDLFGRLEIQRRDPSTRAPRTRRFNSSRDPPFLVLSRLLRLEWLSSISSFYAYALNFRLFLFLSNCLTLFLFTQPVCIEDSRCFLDSHELADVHLSLVPCRSLFLLSI